MKKLYPFALAFLINVIHLSPVSGNEGTTNVGDRLVVKIPDNMVIDNSVSQPLNIVLIFRGDEGVVKGEISVMVKPLVKSTDLDTAWKRMRPGIVSRMEIEREGEEYFAGARWKTVSGYVTLAGLKVKNRLSYTIHDNVVGCIFQYNCAVPNCSDIDTNYDSIKNTIVFR